jgi:NAD dependent epimerase/dehydratase family enzyme
VLHAPAFALRAALGEMSTVLLTGQRVLPAYAEHLGFRFRYRALEPALRSLNL